MRGDAIKHNNVRFSTDDSVCKIADLGHAARITMSCQLRYASELPLRFICVSSSLWHVVTCPVLFISGCFTASLQH